MGPQPTYLGLCVSERCVGGALRSPCSVLCPQDFATEGSAPFDARRMFTDSHSLYMESHDAYVGHRKERTYTALGTPLGGLGNRLHTRFHLPRPPAR